MFSPPQPPRSKPPFAALVLVFFVLLAGSGIVYMFTAESTPSWLSFLIPSSQYTPTERETNASKNARIQEEKEDGAQSVPSSATPARPPQPSETKEAASEKPTAIRPPSASEGGKASLQSNASAPETGSAISGTVPPLSASSPAPEAPVAGESGEVAEPGAHHPVITYGKAKPINGTDSSMVRGSIPEGQNPPGLAQPVQAAAGMKQPPAESPAKEDSVVPLSLIDDMAKFLASNFWPVGTHPMAKDKAISTASLKWANIKYGSQLQGFSVDHSKPAVERQRVLKYVFTPAMIDTLYKLYGAHFFTRLDEEARAQLRGDANLPLDSAQLGDMYDLYAVAAQGIVESIYAYMLTPDVRSLVAAYAKASSDAVGAYRAFSTNMKQKPGNDLDSARRYQASILEREQKREALVSALRRNGAPEDMDADSLAYTAQWLYRRGEGAEESLKALASVLHACALNFRTIGNRYDAMAYSAEGQ